MKMTIRRWYRVAQIMHLIIWGALGGAVGSALMVAKNHEGIGWYLVCVLNIGFILLWVLPRANRDMAELKKYLAAAIEGGYADQDMRNPPSQ